MSEKANLWYLENVDMFKLLCPTKMAGVDLKPMQTSFKKGEHIYFPDEPSNSVFLLEQGRVKLGAVGDNGKEVLNAVLHPGEIFGEMAAFGEERRKDFAVALDDVRVCRMTVDQLKGLMRDYEDFSLRVTRMMGMRLRKMERRLESLVFKDARTRIVDFVREMAEEKGSPVGDETLVRNFLTHKEIASLTGTSRQTVTSVLNELRDKNLIYFDRKRLLVRDLKKLA
jgi:CRP-like cAMP-binding protein